MRKLSRVLLLLAGLALAAYLVQKIGPARIWPQVRSLDWALALYLLVTVTVYVLDTWAWLLSLGYDNARVTLGRLFAVKMAGESVNMITPLGGMGGEPVKVYLLSRTGAALTDAAASVAIAKTTMTLGQIAFIVCGVLAALHSLPQPSPLIWGFAAFPGTILAMILAAAAVTSGVAPRAWQLGVVARLAGVGSLRPALEGLARLWSQVAFYYARHPRAFAYSFAMYFLGWVIGAGELLIATRALGQPLSWEAAFAFEALIVSVTMATFFIPSNVGSQEGGFVAMAPWFGLDPVVGMTLAVVRRFRQLVWLGVGLFCLLVLEGRVIFEPPEPATARTRGGVASPRRSDRA